MASTLFSQTPPARDNLYQNVQFLRRNISIADGASAVLTIGTIPAGSLILKALSGVQVDVVYNSGTNNLMNIGTTANDDLYGTLLSLTAATFVPFDEAVPMGVDADTTITATMALTGTAATTGSGTVVVAFIPKNPPSNEPL